MSKHLPIVGTRPTSLCGECGGQCCQAVPGAYAPEDFQNDEGKLDVDRLFRMLKSGEAVFGVYDGDPDRTSRYYPRPPYKDKGDELVEDRHPYDLGGCANLTDEGCKFSFEERPYGCRTLIPAKNEDGELKCRHPFEMTDKKHVSLNGLSTTPR